MWRRSLALPALLFAFGFSRPHLLPAQEGALPPSRHLHDARYGVSFDLAAGWNVAQKDGDLSTFALDARTADRSTQLRQVAQLAFNPFPASTFSGAFLYFSVSPRSTPRSCENQASAQAPRAVSSTLIDGIPFRHGYDQHGTICTESRDEIYTALRSGTCLRFDLVLNTFCGGDVSGVRSITDEQIAAIRRRMEITLGTVHFDPR